MSAQWEQWSWPDVTLLVVDHLSGEVSAPVGTRVPDPRPVEFVRVQRVGGVAEGPLDRARVLVECWGADESSAALLAGETRDALRRMAGTVPGARVAAVTESGGPALLADPLTGAPRYLVTVVVTVRADPLGS